MNTKHSFVIQTEGVSKTYKGGPALKPLSIVKNPAFLQNQPHLRRLILFGTSLLTGALLLFHPLPEGAETITMDQLGGMDWYN